jgi:nicotinamidase/pyrazinamidase
MEAFLFVFMQKCAVFDRALSKGFSRTGPSWACGQRRILKRRIGIDLRNCKRREPMEINARDVLLIIDVQNDFCPSGALAVPDGDAVLDPIHRVAPQFAHIILTQDWHPANHASFASAHPGKHPFDQIEAGYGPQTLWPDHCIQGSKGAELHRKLHLPQAELILRKGFRSQIDSYSAFFENDRTTPTGLAGYLRERGLTRVFLAGLAYDYCVGYSALDARRLGFEVIVLRDACRAIDLNGSAQNIEAQFAQTGVELIESGETLAGTLDRAHPRRTKPPA